MVLKELSDKSDEFMMYSSSAYTDVMLVVHLYATSVRTQKYIYTYANNRI